MLNRSVRSGFLALALLGAGFTPALAHPHVFVVAKTEVRFAPDGKVAGIYHTWAFDELYSAFATTGIGDGKSLLTPEQLQPIAKQNIEDLQEYDYFTSARANSQKLEFDVPTEVKLQEDASRNLVLSFLLPLRKPVAVGRAFSYQVYDPSYFVAFVFDEKAGATLAGAPAGCSISMFKPQPLAPEEQKALNESYFSGLSPGADFGIKLADRAIVACP